MTAEKYLEENSDWFDKSPGGEKLYFESEVIKMMEKYSSQTEISDEEIYEGIIKHCRIPHDRLCAEINAMIDGAKWYREQLKQKQ